VTVAPVAQETEPISYNPQVRGGTNGKLVGSSRAFEGRIGKSTTGSSTVYCRACRLGKLKLERAPYTVGVGSQAHQHRAEKAMGKGEESSPETEAHHVGISPQEDRGCTACEMGKGEGAAEEGCLEPAEPA
jgi:hypothetical protein